MFQVPAREHMHALNDSPGIPPQNHHYSQTEDSEAYSGASAVHAHCPGERARKVLPTSHTLNVSLMKVYPLSYLDSEFLRVHDAAYAASLHA